MANNKREREREMFQQCELWDALGVSENWVLLVYPSNIAISISIIIINTWINGCHMFRHKGVSQGEQHPTMWATLEKQVAS